MRLATWNVNSARARRPRLLDWLDQRRRLGRLRDAFNYLGYDDLIEELDRHP